MHLEIHLFFNSVQSYAITILVGRQNYNFLPFPFEDPHFPSLEVDGSGRWNMGGSGTDYSELSIIGTHSSLFPKSNFCFIDDNLVIK